MKFASTKVDMFENKHLLHFWKNLQHLCLKTPTPDIKTPSDQLIFQS
jgi:hypothetical protein